MEAPAQLKTFLTAFSPAVRKRYLQLRDIVWELYPDANELMYDNYNALASGWSITDKLGDVFVNVSIMRANENIHIGFLHGKTLSDPKKVLLGQGNQYRYVVANDPESFSLEYVQKIIRQAHAQAATRRKRDNTHPTGSVIIKSSGSSAKRPRSAGAKRVKKTKKK